MSMITLPVVVTNVPFQGRPLLSTGHGSAAIEKGGGEADVLHGIERRIADVGAAGLIAVRAVVEHGDAVGDELDVSDLLGGDAGDDVIDRAQLGFAPKIEALVHVVVERGHLAVFAAEHLQRGTCIGILFLRHRQVDEQLVDLHEHDSASFAIEGRSATFADCASPAWSKCGAWVAQATACRMNFSRPRWFHAGLPVSCGRTVCARREIRGRSPKVIKGKQALHVRERLSLRSHAAQP